MNWINGCGITGLGAMVAPFKGEACEDCTAAATKVWGGFTNGCRGCCARALSRGPQFAAVRSRQNPETRRAYRAALAQFQLTHDQVREAHAADFEGRDRS